MNELTHLSNLRKQYSELLKLFFYEIQNGKQLQELSELKLQIDAARLEIERLEKDLNIKNDPLL
jgi:hypothetical protein